MARCEGPPRYVLVGPTHVSKDDSNRRLILGAVLDEEAGHLTEGAAGPDAKPELPGSCTADARRLCMDSHFA
jgi:hypothetical protein